MLGTGKATEVSKEATTTLDGAGDRETLGKRTDLLRSTTCTTTPDYEGEKLAARARRRAAAGARNARLPSAPPTPPPRTPPAEAASENERARLPRESRL